MNIRQNLRSNENPKAVAIKFPYANVNDRIAEDPFAYNDLALWEITMAKVIKYENRVQGSGI